MGELAERLDGAAWAEAAARAWDWIKVEVDRGLPSTLHTMVFPAWAGFSASGEVQRSDTFARGVVASTLLDCTPQAPAWAPPIEALARAELTRLETSRALHGRLAYFPDLPELPADADSLASAVSLAARLAPERLDRWAEDLAEPLEALEAGRPAPTWLRRIGPAEGRAARERGIRAYWGEGLDPAVNARLLKALQETGQVALVRRALPILVAARAADGLWRAPWYWGDVHPTCLALDAIAAAEPTHPALRPEALLGRQLPDGGWGIRRAEPLPTAHALHTLLHLDAPPEALRRGGACLLDLQRRDGAWGDSPWIKMAVARVQGGTHEATFGSVAVATAFGLRACLGLARRLTRPPPTAPLETTPWT